MALNYKYRSNQQKKEDLDEQINESFQEKVERYNKSIMKCETENQELLNLNSKLTR